MTVRSPQDWVLSIDFGTTATAGATRSNGDVELVEFYDSRRMPSMVCWKEASSGAPGRLLLGDQAENEAGFAPQCVERCPKRRLGQEFMLLGSERVRVTDAIGHIFEHVIGVATPRRGGRRPQELRLTHPARWGEKRLGKLRQAAAFAGFDDPLLVPEPVGAAVYFAEKQLNPGDHVAVYDLGGGTFDTAVLERTRDGFTVIGKPGGRDDLGGEDFDELLYEFLGEQLDPEQWQTLISPDADTSWLRAHHDFRRGVSRAKERLSQWPDAKVRTPIPGTPDLQVSVSEFENLIRGKIDVTVSELDRTVSAAGQSFSSLSAIYLAGGSSQIPLVSRCIQAAFGIAPSLFGDPKGVIALGATRASVEVLVAPPPVEPVTVSAQSLAAATTSGTTESTPTPTPASGLAADTAAAATTTPGPELTDDVPAGGTMTPGRALTEEVPAGGTTTPGPGLTEDAPAGGPTTPAPLPHRETTARPTPVARIGSAGLAGGGIVALGAVLVIVSRFLQFTDGVTSWHVLPKRYSIVLMAAAVVATALVVAGLTLERARLLRVASYLGAYTTALALPIALIGSYQFLEIGFWLCIAGGVLITAGSTIAEQRAGTYVTWETDSAPPASREIRVLTAVAVLALALLIVSLLVRRDFSGSAWTGAPNIGNVTDANGYAVDMTVLALVGIVMIGRAFGDRRLPAIGVAALSAFLLGQAFPLVPRNYTGLKAGFWLGVAAALIAFVTCAVAEALGRGTAVRHEAGADHARV